MQDWIPIIGIALWGALAGIAGTRRFMAWRVRHHMRHFCYEMRKAADFDSSYCCVCKEAWDCQTAAIDDTLDRWWGADWWR